jgi:WD40 repeat protein
MTLSRRHFLVCLAAGTAAEPARGQESNEPIAVRWNRPTPRLSEIAVSGDGQRIAALSLDGDLSCFDLGGNLLWQRPNVEADALALSQSGDLLVAWTRNGSSDARLLLFNAVGRCFAAPEVTGPPSCLAISGDGKRIASGIGDALMLFGITANGVIRREIPTGGTVKRVLAGFSDTFFVLTDPPCRLSLLKSRGKELWHRDLPQKSNCSVVSSIDGKEVVLAYEKSGEEIEILLATWKNEELWRTRRPGRAGIVRMNGKGGVVLLAYDHLVEHQQESRHERRLAYLGENGVGGWTKGGALTAPLAVALDFDGDWLVALDNDRARGGSRFRLYGRDGNRNWIYTAPAGVHLAVSSANGRTIAVYQADGTLSVLQVNGAGRRG